jgi:diguanylate cyclase (GGDEF)-like protein
VLVSVQEKDHVALVAQRILDSLDGKVIIDAIQLQASASIGVAIFPDDADDAATLLKHADTAMYRSKQEGRNTYRFWDEKMSFTSHAN